MADPGIDRRGGGGGAPIFSRINTHHSWQSQPFICSRGVRGHSHPENKKSRPQMAHSGAYFGRNMVVLFVFGTLNGGGGEGAPVAPPSGSATARGTNVVFLLGDIGQKKRLKQRLVECWSTVFAEYYCPLASKGSRYLTPFPDS